MQHIAGVDMSSGSLGQGISAAVGMALAGKMDKKDYRVYTLLGDGEIQEGQVWEASMFAGTQKAGQSGSRSWTIMVFRSTETSQTYAHRTQLIRSSKHSIST